MPVFILVNKSSVPKRDGRCVVNEGSVFRVMVERRAGYQAAFVKVTPAGVTTKSKVYRVALEQAHNMCVAEWTMGAAVEVHVAWLPERATRSRYVAKKNTGDHVCTQACECVPDGQVTGETRLLQSYAPFPGMPASAGRSRDNEGWVDRWQSLPLTPELIAAKQAVKAKIEALNEEYDVKPADFETITLTRA